jgi:hypothetical protein
LKATGASSFIGEPIASVISFVLLMSISGGCEAILDILSAGGANTRVACNGSSPGASARGRYINI